MLQVASTDLFNPLVPIVISERLLREIEIIKSTISLTN